MKAFPLHLWLFVGFLKAIKHWERKEIIKDSTANGIPKIWKWNAQIDPTKKTINYRTFNERVMGRLELLTLRLKLKTFGQKCNLFCPKSTWNSFCVEVLETSILAYSSNQQSGPGTGAEEALLPNASAPFLVFSPFFHIDFPFCRPSFWAKVGIAVKTELITMTTTNTHTRIRLTFVSDMHERAAAGSPRRSKRRHTRPPASMEEKKKKRREELQVWRSDPSVSTWGVVPGQS